MVGLELVCISFWPAVGGRGEARLVISVGLVGSALLREKLEIRRNCEAELAIAWLSS